MTVELRERLVMLDDDTLVEIAMTVRAQCSGAVWVALRAALPGEVRDLIARLDRARARAAAQQAREATRTGQMLADAPILEKGSR